MILNNLPYPPSINTYYRSICVNGRPHVLISKKGREYRIRIEGSVYEQINSQGSVLDCFEGNSEMWINLYPPDKRKRDADNPIKPLWDSLGYAGVFRDDSQIKKYHVTMHDPVKGGRVDVTITPIAHVKDGKVVGLKQETTEK